MSPHTDLFSGWRRALLIWGIPIAVVLVTGYGGAGPTVLTVAWTLSFLMMGIACVSNALRCGRVHCWFTGPLFLILAAASLLHGTGVVPLGRTGWMWIGNSFGLGGIFFYFVPELVWGRFFGSARHL